MNNLLHFSLALYFGFTNYTSLLNSNYKKLIILSVRITASMTMIFSAETLTCISRTNIKCSFTMKITFCFFFYGGICFASLYLFWFYHCTTSSRFPLNTFLTPLQILETFNGHFGISSGCSIAGSERIPPSPLGWYSKW